MWKEAFDWTYWSVLYGEDSERAAGLLVVTVNELLISSVNLCCVYLVLLQYMLYYCNTAGWTWWD